MKSSWLLTLLPALMLLGACETDELESPEDHTTYVLDVYRNQELVEVHTYTDSKLIMDRYKIPWSNVWDTAEYHYTDGRLDYIVHRNAKHGILDTSDVVYDQQQRTREVGYRDGGKFMIEYNGSNLRKRITLMDYFIYGVHEFENENSKYAYFSRDGEEAFDTTLYEVTPNPLHRFWMTHPNLELMSKKNISMRKRKRNVEFEDWFGDIHILTYFEQWNYEYTYDLDGRVSVMKVREAVSGNVTEYSFDLNEFPI